MTDLEEIYLLAVQLPDSPLRERMLLICVLAEMRTRLSDGDAPGGTVAR